MLYRVRKQLQILAWRLWGQEAFFSLSHTPGAEMLSNIIRNYLTLKELHQLAFPSAVCPRVLAPQQLSQGLVLTIFVQFY